MSDGESKAAVTMVRGAPATRYEGNSAGKALRLAAGDEVTVHAEQAEAAGAARATSFRVERLLSTTSSGQACVCQVRDPAGAAFALKVYHGERDAKVRPSEELLARYAALKHPNLVSVRAHGYGADGIEGAYDWELLELLEPLRFPQEDGPRDAWLEQRLAPALGAAAEVLLSAALVHCDIKPANVMQRPSTGEIVLVDIGSLKGVNAETKESVTEVATTSAYAAPELLRKHVNEKTDAFSIGMTLFEFAQPGSLSSPRDKEVVARISRGQPVLDRLGSAPRLCDLVNGLTRGDLTARWGCEEFRQWVSGKQVAAPAPEIKLPVIKWRKQQISTVPALLEVMADETAFWSMCEDEGDLPHTLRQWVHTLHDETVGAALSRLVKRCLTKDDLHLGVSAIRRVLVPTGAFTVNGKLFDGTPSGALEAIRGAGQVTADVEIALRLWAHDDPDGAAAALLALLPAEQASKPQTKRGGMELRTGCMAPPGGWEGAKFWLRLRGALLAPASPSVAGSIATKLRDELRGRALEAELKPRLSDVIRAVPVGTPDGPWTADLEVVALLLPDASEVPTKWEAWRAAKRTQAVVAFGETVISDHALEEQEPAQIRALWDWPPGNELLRGRFPQSRDAQVTDAGVETVLWASGRKWLVAGELILERPDQLSETSAEAGVAEWLEADLTHRLRLLRWLDAVQGEVHPPSMHSGGRERSKERELQGDARETLVAAFRRINPIPSDAEREAAAREVIRQVPIGIAELPWRGSARWVAILAPKNVAQPSNWELFEFARRVLPAVCVRGEVLGSEELLSSLREDLEDCWNWAPGQSVLAGIVPAISQITDSEEAVEQLLRLSARDWLVVGASEIREPDQLEKRQTQAEILRWLQGRRSRAQRLLAWAWRHNQAASTMEPGAEANKREQERPEDSRIILRAHELLWSSGARGLSIERTQLTEPLELPSAPRVEVAHVLGDRVGRAWLKHLGGAWSELLSEEDIELAVHRLWWAAGSTKLELENGRAVSRPEDLASIDECEAVLASNSGREWLTRLGGGWAAVLEVNELELAAHELWWEIGGRSIRIPATQRVVESPWHVLTCADAEVLAIAASTSGRAWLQRHDVAVPVAGPWQIQLLRWVLGDRTLRVASETGSVELSLADWERAPLATVRRVWNGWGPISQGWMQRLASEVPWSSIELPSHAAEKILAARLLTRLANIVRSEPPLLLGVRGENVDWEKSKIEDASFAALVELEQSLPGMLNRAMIELRRQAEEVFKFLMSHHLLMKNNEIYDRALRISDQMQLLSLTDFHVPVGQIERIRENCERMVDSIESDVSFLDQNTLENLRAQIYEVRRGASGRIYTTVLDAISNNRLLQFCICVVIVSCCSWVVGGTILGLSLGSGLAGFILTQLVRRRSVATGAREHWRRDADQGIARLAQLLNLVRRRSLYLSRALILGDRDILSLASRKLISRIEEAPNRNRFCDELAAFGVVQFEVAATARWYIERMSASLPIRIVVGVADNPEAVIRMSEAKLDAILAGKGDPIDDWQENRVQIVGNHGYALLLLKHLLRE